MAKDSESNIYSKYLARYDYKTLTMGCGCLLILVNAVTFIIPLIYAIDKSFSIFTLSIIALCQIIISNIFIYTFMYRVNREWTKHIKRSKSMYTIYTNTITWALSVTAHNTYNGTEVLYIGIQIGI
ncbi:hypothetical protein [Candidatus Mesenet endosymbiont of Agriotes lineatus]|uniref:hypothetical protein n=1 Tax=Candidatus Mesenet endosymbiont of Agriotes lineatus TaxID=3077948 RepID=UPI0030D18893